MLVHIQPHSQARNQGGRGEACPILFENRKKCPDFGKKGPGCVHLWGKIFIENIVLRVSRRKNFKLFPCGASISCVFYKMFIEVP